MPSQNANFVHSSARASSSSRHSGFRRQRSSDTFDNDNNNSNTHPDAEDASTAAPISEADFSPTAPGGQALVGERPVEAQPDSAFTVVPRDPQARENELPADTKEGQRGRADASAESLSKFNQDGNPKLKGKTTAGKGIAAAKVLSSRLAMGRFATRAPGIDPRRVSLPELKAKIVIQSVDYNSQRADFNVITNDELPAFLDKGRPDFAKVRWVHVNGLDWEVIKRMALEFDLHPLSLEDMLHHGTASARSKADWYKQHLFVSCVVHKTLESTLTEVNSIHPGTPGRPMQNHLREQLGFHSEHHNSGDMESQPEVDVSDLPRYDEADPGAPLVLAPPLSTGGNTPDREGSYSAYQTKLQTAFSGVQLPSEEDFRQLSPHVTGMSKRLRRKAKPSKRTYAADKARHSIDALTKDVKVRVHVEQLSIYVLRDGTILSFTQDVGFHGRLSGIFGRIASRDDILRGSEDASFVLQALLDVICDDALGLIDDFREIITDLEAKVLVRPSLEDVRHLHIASAQLLLLKSSLSPLEQVLLAIRNSDDAKSLAAFRSGGSADGEAPPGGKHHPVGFVSHEAKVYISDPLDHLQSVLASLDLFSDLTENLISYTFNSLNFSSASYVQALSVLSVIFLPLTFLSGYFGMNFETFDHVLNGSVSYFWKIAIPTAVAAVIIFSWEYLWELGKLLRRLFLRATYARKK